MVNITEGIFGCLIFVWWNNIPLFNKWINIPQKKTHTHTSNNHSSYNIIIILQLNLYITSYWGNLINYYCLGIFKFVYFLVRVKTFTFNIYPCNWVMKECWWELGNNKPNTHNWTWLWLILLKCSPLVWLFAQFYLLLLIYYL